MGRGNVRTRSGFDTGEGRQHQQSVCKANITYAAKFCWDFILLNFWLLDIPKNCRLYILLALRICMYGLEGVVMYALSATVVSLSEGDGNDSFLVDLVELVLCRGSKGIESVQNQLNTIGKDRQRRQTEDPLASNLPLSDGLIQSLNSTFPGLISQSLLDSNDSLAEAAEKASDQIFNQADSSVDYPTVHATPNPWAISASTSGMTNSTPTPGMIYSASTSGMTNSTSTTGMIYSTSTSGMTNTTLWDGSNHNYQDPNTGSFAANLCLRITNLETEEVLAYCSSTATEPVTWLALVCLLMFCAGLLYGFLCSRYKPGENQAKLDSGAASGPTPA